MTRPHDTSLGGPSPTFPSTIWPLIEDLKNRHAADPQAAMANIVTHYWKPVYVCIRDGWKFSNEDAKDLTQEFFLFLLEGTALQAADPRRGRFRHFLKTVLQNFLSSEHRKANRLKRGGGSKQFSIDATDEPSEVYAAPGAGPEEIFDREWARSLVEEVVKGIHESLASSGRESHWKVFEAHDLSANPPTYQELGAPHGLTESQVMHLLQETRRKIRENVILKIKEYALDEDEVWQELDYLMGLWHA